MLKLLKKVVEKWLEMCLAIACVVVGRYGRRLVVRANIVSKAVLSANEIVFNASRNSHIPSHLSATEKMIIIDV
jgi:hypothetical protein